MSMYLDWALAQQDAANNVDWSYCWDPNKYNSACAGRGVGIPPPPPKPVMDMEPMPPPIATLVPEATSAPAPTLPAGWGGNCNDLNGWWQTYIDENPGTTESGVMAAWATACPVQAMTQETMAARNMAFGNTQLQIQATLSQSVAVAKIASISQSNAAQAQITVAPTASGAPPPAQAPVAPSALPSTGIIVGAAIGVAALLMLV